MKIIDCFPFFNELDILRMRLELLSEHVDKFLICESDVTHSGEKKPFYYEENKDAFKKWENQIVHLKYCPDLSGLDFSRPEKFDKTHAAWQLETGQRNYMSDYLRSLQEHSYAIVSDVDEFWNPKKLSDLIDAANENGAVRIGMDLHYFYMNCKGIGPGNSKWASAYCISSKLIEKYSDLSQIRVNAKLKIYPDCGWHFSYLGNVDSIIKKIESMAHQELNMNQNKDAEHLFQCLSHGFDPYKRADHLYAFFTVDSFPKVIADLMRKNQKHLKVSLI